jgi:hypothetical protein
MKGDAIRRREFVTLLGGAAATPAAVLGLRTSWAQGAAWREFRRDDVGFRIEFPGEPRIRVQTPRTEQPWIATTNAQARYGSEIFDLTWTEFKAPVSAEEEYKRFRDMMTAAGYERVDETPLTINDVPAREFIIETGAVNFVRRILAVRNLAIAIHVIGRRNLQNTGAVVRYLESFRLLDG